HGRRGTYPAGAIGHEQDLVSAQAAGARPIYFQAGGPALLDARPQSGKLPAVGCHEEELHWAIDRAGRWNHSTARARAASAGPGLNPSSRRAFSWVTHIFFLAMRTAS